MLRELATRYGRNSLGFFWVVGEPLLFCIGVLILWTAIKPPYEHGVRIIPFVVTGYMPIILVRHMVTHAMNCVRSNASLLYHKSITVLHLFTARLVLEFISVTFAFVLVLLVLGFVGLVSAPEQLSLVYGGWCLLAWTSFGLAMSVAALAEMYEIVERFVAVVTYVLVPLSGTFYMAAWLPENVRRAALTLPFLHSVEMVRAGYFGSSVRTYYDVGYAAAWAAVLTLVGLLLLRFVRARVEVD
jgi:capsular polysaccharide transport system permease protein